jgi:Bacterial Ig-like domain
MLGNKIVQRSLLAVVVGAFIQGCSCGDSPKIAFEPPEPVRGAPTASGGLDVDLCPGASATLGTAATAGLRYTWTPAEGLSDPNAAQPVATPSHTTVYTLSVSDPGVSKSGTDTVQVRVLPAPAVGALESRTMGAGGSTVLQGGGSGGSGALRYAWTASPECADCISDRSAAQPTVSPAEDTTFTVTVTDEAGCSASATAQVHVAPALAARALAANAAGAGVCAGGSTLIGDEATGGAPPYTYAWTSACETCLSDPHVARPSVTVTEDTVFTQTVTDANGNTASASVTVTAAAPPAGLAGDERFVSPGSSVELGAEAAAGASYAWSCERDDCAFGPSDTATSRVVVQPTHSTRYALDAASGAYCSVSSAVTVWVALQTDSLPNGTEAAFPQNAKLVVQFDQPMDAASLTASTVQVLDVDENVLPTSHELSADGHFLVVSVTGGAYAAGNDYTLVLTGGPDGVRSADGVRPNILPGDLLVDYTLGAADTAAPSITFRSPAPDATDAPINSFLLVVFSEPMLPTTITATSVTLTGETSGPVQGSLSYDLQGNFLSLRPTALLNLGERYTVSLTGLSDPAGNPLPDTSWSFTVGQTSDEVAPTVASVTPADGATSVRATSPVTLVFSEVVDPTSLGGIEVRDAEGARLAGRLIYTPANATVVFTPAQLLGSHVEYRVHAEGVRDLVGNAMAAPFESRFTTRRILFFDDFEQGTEKWALQAPTGTGPSWGLESRSYRSAFHSLSDSVKRKYANHSDTAATVAGSIDLGVPGSDPAQAYSEVVVQFWLRARLERLNDFALLEYSFDGGSTWTEGGRYGKQNAGSFRELTLANPNGATGLLLRFRLTSDGKKNFDGISVDDVLVQGP